MNKVNRAISSAFIAGLILTGGSTVAFAQPEVPNSSAQQQEGDFTPTLKNSQFPNEYLKTAPNDTARASVEAAKKGLTTPGVFTDKQLNTYVFGGGQRSSVDGFDQLGAITWAFKESGVKFDTNAALTGDKDGKKDNRFPYEQVNREDAKPGDIIVFQSKSDKSKRTLALVVDNGAKTVWSQLKSGNDVMTYEKFEEEMVNESPYEGVYQDEPYDKEKDKQEFYTIYRQSAS